MKEKTENPELKSKRLWQLVGLILALWLCSLIYGCQKDPMLYPQKFNPSIQYMDSVQNAKRDSVRTRIQDSIFISGFWTTIQSFTSDSTVRRKH